MKNTIFRTMAYLSHHLTAWNTGGEGIHSPYLFYMVRMLFYDANSYYCFAPIEHQRNTWLATHKPIEVDDFGSGAERNGAHYTRTIADIARTSLESQQVGQLLFRLTMFLTHEAGRPLQIVELGTSLGITTAYLALPDSKNRITTFEGCGAVAVLARKTWEKVGAKNVNLIEGNIDDTLGAFLNEQAGTIDIAYIDANHTEEATLRYFRLLRQRAGEKSIVVVDDIHHSKEMERAWRQIEQEEGVTSTMDLFYIGIVLFDPHYMYKNYRLRI